MQSLRYQYSTLYEDFQNHPELTRFRRYTKETGWMIYEQSAIIKRLTDECNAAIKDIQEFGPGDTVFTVTDLHLVHMGNEHPSLDEKIGHLKVKVDALKKEMRQYMRDVFYAQAVAKFPDQSGVYSKAFAEMSNLCVGGKFGPTGESDEYYTHPPHPDTYSFKRMDAQDPFTAYLVNNVKTLYEKLSGKGDDQETPRRPSIKLSTICRVVNLLVCLYAPLMFTASIAILYTIRPTKIRIAVAGLLGVVVAISILLLVPGIRRGELFAIIAAYFAIAGVFIGASDNGGR